MARLGTRTPGGRTYDLHQGDVVIDEEAISCGARLLASVVVAHTVKAGGDVLKREAAADE
jgi:amidohydrolase